VKYGGVSPGRGFFCEAKNLERYHPTEVSFAKQKTLRGDKNILDF